MIISKLMLSPCGLLVFVGGNYCPPSDFGWITARTRLGAVPGLLPGALVAR
jgi:hypothetical protein